MTMLLSLGIGLAARRYLLPLTSLLHTPIQFFGFLNMKTKLACW